jgi:hypothetical protein
METAANFVWKDETDNAVLAQLYKPFPRELVKVLVVESKKTGAVDYFDYIEMRTVQNRLDDVFGRQNWMVDYEPFGSNGVKCTITATLPSGRSVTGCCVGGMSATRDPSDVEKSGSADGLKRAAVTLGVFRYAYGEGIPEWVRPYLSEEELAIVDSYVGKDTRIDPRGGSSRGGGAGTQRPWQERLGGDHGQRQAPRGQRPQVAAQGGGGRVPTTGKELWAACSKAQMVDNLKAWAREMAENDETWERRIYDYTPEQVAYAYKHFFEYKEQSDYS